MQPYKKQRVENQSGAAASSSAVASAAASVEDVSPPYVRPHRHQILSRALAHHVQSATARIYLRSHGSSQCRLICGGALVSSTQILTLAHMMPSQKVLACSSLL